MVSIRPGMRLLFLFLQELVHILSRRGRWQCVRYTVRRQTLRQAYHIYRLLYLNKDVDKLTPCQCWRQKVCTSLNSVKL